MQGSEHDPPMGWAIVQGHDYVSDLISNGATVVTALLVFLFIAYAVSGLVDCVKKNPEQSKFIGSALWNYFRR